MQVRTVTLYQVEMTSTEMDLLAQVAYDARTSYGKAFETVALEFSAAVEDIREREHRAADATVTYPAKPVTRKN